MTTFNVRTTDGDPIQFPAEPIRDPNRQGQQRRLNTKKPFVMWDGEACKDTSYCLFGNSKGDTICEPRRLTTKELIEFMLSSAERHEKAFHFGYGFDYDVDNILWDLPKWKLGMLAKNGKILYKIGKQTYRITYIPRKIFSVTELTRVRRDKIINGEPRLHYSYDRGRTIRIEDVVSYFNTRYDKALAKFKVGTSDELEAMAQDKDNREYFMWADIEDIKVYWRLELKLGPPLMDKMRSAIHGAGFYIGQWYGPGAIAKYMMRENHVSKYMAESPEEVHNASLYAFAGGWFERFGMGYYEGPVYIPDINNAYPWGISQLPNLANGHWRHIRHPDKALPFQYRMSLYYIRYNIPVGKQRQGKWFGKPFPLFQRTADGSIFHPMATNGWYHAPEARLLYDDPFAFFIEAWVFEDDGEYPFEWINDIYLKRLALKAENNPAELGIKLGLNSWFGSTAQRSGWNRKTRKAPPTHQIEWAGLITSYTRNLIYRAANDAIRAGYTLLSIDTDSITYFGNGNGISDLPNGIGNQLGRWKMTEYSGILYVQNGVYWLRDMEGNWLPPKTRGIARNRLTSIAAGIDALQSKTYPMQVRQYMGFRHALVGDWSKRGEWYNREIEFSPQWAGARKHIKLGCEQCANGVALTEGIHMCWLWQPPKKDPNSFPHKLPWEQPNTDKKDMNKFMQMIVAEES